MSFVQSLPPYLFFPDLLIVLQNGTKGPCGDVLVTVSEPRAGQRAVCLLVPSPPFAPAAAVGVAQPGEQRPVANHGKNFTFLKRGLAVLACVCLLLPGWTHSPPPLQEPGEKRLLSCLHCLLRSFPDALKSCKKSQSIMRGIQNERPY